MADAGILPIAEWPVCHRNNWEAGLRPPTFLDEAGAAARWRQQTIRTTAASYGRWLWFLREIGFLVPDLAPELLASPDHVRAYINHLKEVNAPATVLHRLVGLERALAVIAPQSNRYMLRCAINNLAQDYEPVSKRERLQESAALLALGFRLMERAVTASRLSKCRRSAMFRDGLQIALLALRPLRLRNFSSIEIGRHLIEVGGRWRLIFPGAETKNRKPIDVPFPDELLLALRDYLTVYRPQLAQGSCNDHALWISACGTPHSPISIRSQICRRTKKAFGLPITPHLFRDCAATSLAVHEPEAVQIAHHVLGNDYLTMERFYNQARAADAASHFHAALEARIKKSN